MLAGSLNSRLDFGKKRFKNKPTNPFFEEVC